MDKGKMGKDNAWGYGVIDVEKLIGTKPEPAPEPEPDIPHPYPEPEKPEDPEEDAENWRRILIKVGVVIAIGLASLTISECNKEKPEVNWDEKFKKEMEVK